MEAQCISPACNRLAALLGCGARGEHVLPRGCRHGMEAPGLQVYDDLGTAEQPRPALGGSAELPYPRHLSNNRAQGAEGPGKPWLPFGERRGGGGRGRQRALLCPVGLAQLMAD